MLKILRRLRELRIPRILRKPTGLRMIRMPGRLRVLEMRRRVRRRASRINAGLACAMGAGMDKSPSPFSIPSLSSPSTLRAFGLLGILRTLRIPFILQCKSSEPSLSSALRSLPSGRRDVPSA
jgi:hypothetical protein